MKKTRISQVGGPKPSTRRELRPNSHRENPRASWETMAGKSQLLAHQSTSVPPEREIQLKKHHFSISTSLALCSIPAEAVRSRARHGLVWSRQNVPRYFEFDFRDEFRRKCKPPWGAPLSIRLVYYIELWPLWTGPIQTIIKLPRI